MQEIQTWQHYCIERMTVKLFQQWTNLAPLITVYNKLLMKLYILMWESLWMEGVLGEILAWKLLNSAELKLLNWLNKLLNSAKRMLLNWVEFSNFIQLNEIAEFNWIELNKSCWIRLNKSCWIQQNRSINVLKN